jgi:hypothetical protein
MTANRELTYWNSNPDWYDYDEKKGEFYMTDKAPERAIKSFEMALAHSWKNRLKGG